jgi:glucoamylase
MLPGWPAGRRASARPGQEGPPAAENEAESLGREDGFSPDQARGFAPTPQPFQFGVCASASTDPHCTVDPGTVPKAMDVLTPDGTTQADELDYTLHSPVTIAPVIVP